MLPEIPFSTEEELLIKQWLQSSPPVLGAIHILSKIFGQVMTHAKQAFHSETLQRPLESHYIIPPTSPTPLSNAIQKEIPNPATLPERSFTSCEQLLEQER